MIGKRTPFTKDTAAEYFAVIDRTGNRRERRRSDAFKRRMLRSRLHVRFGGGTRQELGLEKVEPQPLQQNLRAMMFGYYRKVLEGFSRAFGQKAVV